MPRRSTITGRTGRNATRNRIRTRRNNNNNADENNNDIELAIENDLDILNDTNKCALNVVPRNFDSYSCGALELICLCCQAKHFQSEITSRNQNAFSLCCHKGKVGLPSLTSNIFFQTLIEGLTSNDQSIKQRSKNYFSNIRSNNSAFAMVSSEAQIDRNLLNGIYHFKIHDVFYHRAGAFTTAQGRNPIYAQLYFYDVDTAVQHRMNAEANVHCELNLMRELALELDRVNPFVRSFRSMADYCQQPANIAAEVFMVK